MSPSMQPLFIIKYVALHVSAFNNHLQVRAIYRPITFLHAMIMLHVWGFLGNVTWALSRNNAVVQCYVSLAKQQFKRRAYPQHCYARDNRHGDVSMFTGLLSSDFYWYSQSCLEIAECRRACVFGYGLLLVGRLSSYREIAREAREFIPWTVKTVDRRGKCRLVMDYTPRCCCGVQVDR
jgi:hypothetical protein